MGREAGNTIVRHRRAGTAAALILALALSLGATSSADAYKLWPFKWPEAHPKLSYYVAAKQHRWAIGKAARAWNRSGARITLRKTKSSSKADVIIGFLPGRYQAPGFCVPLGYASTIGVPVRPARIWLQRFRGNPPAGRCRWEMARVAAHEFGHILGLGHENRRCAVMNGVPDNHVGRFPAKCRPESAADSWYCRLLEADDIRGVVKRYGGRVRERGPLACPAPNALNNVVVG